MLTIPTAQGDPDPNALPALANMVMSTCSFMLNGPGLSENRLDPNPGIRNFAEGSTACMKWPTGRVATCTVICVIISGSVRQAKNWFRNERSEHESRPRNHIRKVQTGRVESSVFVTVSRTSSIGDTSSSSTSTSPATADLTAVGFSGSEIAVAIM